MDLEGDEALDRMWVALRSAVEDPKERAAFAIYWAANWGIHYNEDQMASRLSWLKERMRDEDVEHRDDDGSHLTRGRDHYRVLAAAAACALLTE